MSDAFYKKLAEIVEANLENEQFGVEDLVREIGLSRSQVHRKLHEETGQSISQFIREIRLQRAHEMLVDRAGTASEIAFKVGFGSPTYFSKCFVEYFGYTPGEVEDKSATPDPTSTPLHLKKLRGRERRFGKIIIPAIIIMLLLVAAWLVYENIRADSVDRITGTDENAIAVLYFDNISGDASQDYLSDGVTDEIISRLSLISGLRVPGLSSVKPFKGKSIPLDEIARQLNVNVVLEGTVKKSGDKLRITVRLVDIPNNQTLWTNVYERSYLTTEIFEIQSDIAKSVGRKFQLMITPTVESSEPPTLSIEAYDLFLQATSLTLAYGVGMPVNHLNKSEAQLKQAIKIDPDFAKAYLELAKIFNYRYLASLEGGTKRDSLETLVRMAVSKDPGLVEGYIHLASISSSEVRALGFLSRISISDSTWIWLRKAYELDPVQGLIGFGNLYAAKGDWPEAVQCYNEVLKVSPGQIDALLGKTGIFGSMDLPDSSRKYLSLVNELYPGDRKVAFLEISNLYLMMRKYVLNGEYEMFDELLRSYYRDDQQSMNYRMGIAYLFGRRFEDAERYYQASGYRDMDVGLLLLETGRGDSGRHLLKQALDLRLKFKDRVFLFDLVRIYAVLGKNDEAVDYFRRSISGGFKDIGWINCDPFIDYIKNDPEFKKVFAQLLGDNELKLQRIKELENEPFDLNQLIP